MVGGEIVGGNMPTNRDKMPGGHKVGNKMAQNEPRAVHKGLEHVALDKEQKIWDLRLLGWSYREIAQKTGIDKTTVGDLIGQRIQKINKETTAEAKEYIRLEIERLDKMLAFWLPQVRHRNPDDPDETPHSPDTATQNVLRIMNRRAKYLGLDAPTQVNVDGKVDLNILITQSYLPPGQTQFPDNRSLVDGKTITITEADYGDAECEDIRDPEDPPGADKDK